MLGATGVAGPRPRLVQDGMVGQGLQRVSPVTRVRRDDETSDPRVLAARVTGAGVVLECAANERERLRSEATTVSKRREEFVNRTLHR